MYGIHYLLIGCMIVVLMCSRTEYTIQYKTYFFNSEHSYDNIITLQQKH